MEGKYLTKDQRVGLSHQIRKTHFTLGGGGNSYHTTSTNFLKPPNLPATARYNTNLSKDLRKTHLQMGAEAPNKQRVSEFAFSYSPMPLSSNTADFAKKDLRRHNMVLGTTGITYKTTTATDFKGGEVMLQHIKSAQQIERNLRKHHFEFGTDSLTMNSTAAANFGKKKMENTEKNEALKKDLSESHFIMGKAPMMMRTTSQKEFAGNGGGNGRGGITQGKLNELKKEHFQLGTDVPALASTASQFFTAKQNGKQDLNQEKLNDLRSSHFVLGKTQASYATAANPPKKKPKSASNSLAPYSSGIAIRDTHFTLGNEGNCWKTSYNGDHQIQIANNSGDKKVDSHLHLSSSFKFGASKTPISNSQASFKNMDKHVVEKPDPKLMKELRNHHFHLGDGGDYYKTTSSQVGLGFGEPGKIDKKVANDLRSSHFKYGADPVNFLSTNMKDFVHHTEKGAKSNADLAKNLRKTHFKIGEDKTQWKTEQQNNFRWIQPVPDTGFKISLI